MANEDFDVSSLATYLHLTPDQVKKMADRGKIPGRRVGGVWRFSEAEIHQWFEERIGISDDIELTKVEKVLATDRRSSDTEESRITKLIATDTIFIPFQGRTKRSVISGICEQTALTGKLWDANKMAEAIRSREALHPTALGNGVALLHPRRPMPSILGDPFVALGITSSGIPFGGPRGCLTDIFFLLGSTSEAQHLRVLARLSRLIQQPELLEMLREAEDSNSAWERLAEFDQNLD